MKDEMGFSVTIAIFEIVISPAPTTYSSFILPPSSLLGVYNKSDLNPSVGIPSTEPRPGVDLRPPNLHRVGERGDTLAEMASRMRLKPFTRADPTEVTVE